MKPFKLYKVEEERLIQINFNLLQQIVVTSIHFIFPYYIKSTQRFLLIFPNLYSFYMTK
jgi:hypothetical protein